MKIIDLHAHIRRDYNLKQYLVEEHLVDMEKNRIDLRMVSALRGKDIHEQNSFVLDFCREHKQFLPCAVLNPKEESCPEEMKWISEAGAFKAVELDPLEHGYIPEITPNIDEVFEMCGNSQMFVKVLVGHGDRTLPGQWEYYVKRHPETKIVFLHIGGMWDGYSAIEVAKKYSNVYLDTSECFELSLFRSALRAVEKDRIIFGSAFPERFTECSITFFDSFPELTDEDREMFYHKNAKKLLEMGNK